ncbi:uncharacterized protein [Primulina huaijiensis]|uniref:uncharacterized protein n=1 Tax=Primulina huaijiensis TaxID=1492673 RepID=UPI003CC7217C
MGPSLTSFTTNITRTHNKFSSTSLANGRGIRAMRIEKSLEELYNVRVERKETGKCRITWDWHVDQLVYVEEGEVRVVPQGSKRYMQFLAGDLIRYPKWLEADLYFNDFYQERYSFRAYGDD